MAGRREGVMGDLAEVGVKVIGHSGGEVTESLQRGMR